MPTVIEPPRVGHPGIARAADAAARPVVVGSFPAGMMRAMVPPAATGIQLDPQDARFVQGGVSVIVASRDAEFLPDVVRGCGCRVSRDRRRVTVLVDRARAECVLADVAANGLIAVVFSRPSTHKTMQLKGSDAERARVSAADRTLAARHREAWIDDLCSVGYARAFAAALWGAPSQEIAAITFTPTAAFEQTPGPAAGQPLER